MRESLSSDMARTNNQPDVTTWLLVTASCLALGALFAAGKGGLLRAAIPAAATLVALSLYIRKPAAYLEFGLWAWILTPFIRRVVDWRVGFADQNLVLLTPFLVSGIAILDLRDRKSLLNLRVAPFALCGAAIGYGFLVGMALHPSGEVVYGLVDWLSPMLLGLHVYLRWRELDIHAAVIQRVALWGLLVLGIYGIVQFYEAPVWDTMWLENLPGGVASSTFGRPEPQEIRVWSTLNAPGPFANVAVALLFLVIPKRSLLKLPAVGAGIYSLMLSLVRTAWITGALGLLYLAGSSNRKLFLKVVFAIGASTLGLALLANSSLDIPILQDRFKTLGDLKNDESVQDRTRLYSGLSKELLSEPVGIGLNNADFYHGYPLDSGPIRMLLNLGWLGTLTYSIGVLQIVWFLYSRRKSHDPLLVTSTTIVVTFLLQMLSGLIFISSSGAMFWLAAGSGLAATMRSAELLREEVSKLPEGVDPRPVKRSVIVHSQVALGSTHVLAPRKEAQ
ncbi:MAG TPA: hypothetical protein VGG85_16965 [Terracidiphilus sp.]|jgi:hypothetical protein